MVSPSQPLKRVHLRDVLQVASTLEAVVQRSFGPGGGQVLFTRDTGQAVLTRSGTRILSALRLEHPLAKTVVDCVWTHSSVTGDGSKTFVLLLVALLRGIQAAAAAGPDAGQTQAPAARRLAHDLLLFAARDLPDVLAAGVLPHCVEDALALRKLLDAFFLTRLGHAHGDVVGGLACELLARCGVRDVRASAAALRFVADNLPALLTPVPGLPVSCSRLMDGLVIHRDFAGYRPPADDRRAVNAVVVTQDLQPAGLSEGDVTQGGVAVAVRAWSERALERVFADLQALGVGAILSAVEQSPAVRARAARARTCLVECVSAEELSLFARLSRTAPVCGGRSVAAVNVAPLSSCRPVLLGAHRYVHVTFPEVEDGVGVRPCSLVLCAPAEGQTDQYVHAVQDGVRTLLTTCTPVDTTSASECGTAELTRPDTGRLLPAGGAFEFLLSHALSQHGRRGGVAPRLLADALLCVPRRIHSQTRFLQMQTAVRTRALSGSDHGEFPPLGGAAGTQALGSDPGLESVSCKYLLLQSVLQCLTALLRVDAVLRTRSTAEPPRGSENTSCRGSEEEEEEEEEEGEGEEEEEEVEEEG